MHPRRGKLQAITGGILMLIIPACIFSPPLDEENKFFNETQWESPTTPKNVINNLKLAFKQRDIDFYEKCLHENYMYVIPPTLDTHGDRWARSEDVRSISNMMTESNEIVFNPVEIRTYLQYGRNIDRSEMPPGAKLDMNNEHPDDIWYVSEYYVSIDVYTRTRGDFKVQQDMKFIMTKDPATNLFSIIRWVDETQSN